MANAPTIFQRRLNVAASKVASLPLIHTTSYLVLQKAIVCGILQPLACKKMNEDLVYLFYGRAAFRSKQDLEPFDIPVHAPIVLIFKPGVIANFRHIYPFDTGNYPHGYSALVDVPMDDFRLDDLACAEKAIQVFWKSRWDYIKFDLSNAYRSQDFKAHDSFAQLYSGLLHHSGIADDRRGTIELACSSGLPVNSTTVLGIVLPTDMLDDPDVSTHLDSIKIATYDWNGGRGSEYFADIRGKVWNIFKDLGI
jgi:hypothetical protein